MSASQPPGDAPPGRDRQPSEWERWLLLAGAALLSVSLAAFELVPASVTPLVRAGLDVGPSGAGLIVSAMFGTAVVTSVPAGLVLDRMDSRVAIAAAVGAFVVAGVWGYFAAGAGAYLSLLASRALGGVAYVVVWNAGIDVVGRSFDAERQATAVGVFTASGPVGFALGQSTGPLVADAFGWPAIFPAFSVISVVGLMLFWPTSRGQGRASGTDVPSRADLTSVATDASVWLVGALAFLAYALYLFVNSWAPAYLGEELGLTLAASGVLAAAFPAMGILSRVTGGVLSDRLFGGRRRPVVLGSFVVATPVVGAFTVPRSIPVVVVALLVAGFAVQLSLGLVYAYVRELVAPDVAATAVALLTSVGLAGAFVSPIAGGALIGAVGYPATFAVAGGLGGVGILLAWRAPEPV